MLCHHYFTLLFIAGSLSSARGSVFSVPVGSCYVDGYSFEHWQTWNGEIGNCVQYKCTPYGIAEKRCASFLESLGADKFQELLDSLNGTKCTFEGADGERPYPECCNRIMCLDVIEPVAPITEDTTAAAAVQRKVEVITAD